MGEWVEIDDIVPLVDDGEMMSDVVLVLSIDRNGDEYTYHSRYSRICGFNDYLATHWMPLSEQVKNGE